MVRKQSSTGFTIIELVVVLSILAVLAAVALPRFMDTSRNARIAALEGVAGTVVTTIQLVKARAYVQGITPTASNPGDQSIFLVDFEGQASEIDWRNLCPESVAELGDRLTMIDFVNLSGSAGLTSQLNNQYTLIGYDIPGFSVPTNQGCYVAYDSFGSPDCTVTTVTVDC